MSAERNWFVRLNLDELADELDALDSTEEHGQWLKGFRVGSRGHGPRDTWEDSRLRGHAFGVKCFEAAEAFREKQSEKGRKSAEAKRTKSQPEVNHGSTTVQPLLEPDWQPEANQPVTSNQKPVTKSEKRSTKFSTEKEQGGCRSDAAAYPAGDAGAYAELYAEHDAESMPVTATVTTTTTKREKKEAPSAPSRSEWDAHAKEAFPWWPRWDIDKAFDYWSARGFTRDGKRIRSDWRRLMGHWAGKYGKDHPQELQRPQAPTLPSGRTLPSGFVAAKPAVEM